MELRTVWQECADTWIHRARSPDLDDDFWQFHLPHFLSLLPPPGRLTVDVGCGEGRLGRITGTNTMPFLHLPARPSAPGTPYADAGGRA